MTSLDSLLKNDDENVINCFCSLMAPLCQTFLKWSMMLHDQPNFCPSSLSVSDTLDSNYETLFPVHKPALCLQEFIHSSAYFCTLHSFTLLYHGHKIKPGSDVIIPIARFLPFSSLVLENISISVIVILFLLYTLTF